MLGKYLTIDGKSFPNPLPSSTHSMDAVENVSQSEAGTDLIVFTRAEKNAWNMNFNLTYHSKEVLKAICKKPKVTMIYMGNTYTVRVRNFSERLVEGSEWLQAAPNGLYEVSVKVTEY